LLKHLHFVETFNKLQSSFILFFDNSNNLFNLYTLNRNHLPDVANKNHLKDLEIAIPLV